MLLPTHTTTWYEDCDWQFLLVKEHSVVSHWCSWDQNLPSQGRRSRSVAITLFFVSFGSLLIHHTESECDSAEKIVIWKREYIVLVCCARLKVYDVRPDKCQTRGSIFKFAEERVMRHWLIPAAFLWLKSEGGRSSLIDYLTLPTFTAHYQNITQNHAHLWPLRRVAASLQDITEAHVYNRHSSLQETRKKCKK